MEHAALYEALGLRTVPLRPRAKRPLREGWQAGGPRVWDDAPSDANVGVLCGSISGGFVALDFDAPDLCREVLGMTPRALAALTPVVETARGHHVWARCDGAATREPRPGFSILGEGSLVVAPPSIHPSGWTYRFLERPRRIADLNEFAVLSLLLGDAEVLHVEASRGDAKEAVEEGALDAVSLEDAFAVIVRQNPRVLDAWALLTTQPPADRVFEGSGPDAWSRADFLIALCLIQHGHEPSRVAALLLSLPGSKAGVRGTRYARLTCERAAETARSGVLPGRRVTN